jgi:PAS domain S-box-containing protein
MKKLLKYRVDLADSMVLIAVCLAAAYWILESIYNLFVGGNQDFVNQILGLDFDIVWPRVFVLCLFVIFGSHVQYTIKKRKSAEMALQDSEEKYRTILQSIEEGYYEVDLSGGITFINDAACRMVGYSRDELLGIKGQDFISRETAYKAVRVFNTVLQTGLSDAIPEFHFIHSDGRSRILELSISLRKNRQNRPVGFRGVARDVTDRLKAEKEKKRLAALMHEARAATILGLAKLAEYRDEGTGKHLERIREYSRILAERMSRLPLYEGYITKKYIEDIYRSSILHDIGKVGIPDAILLKPAELTPDEFKIIKTHTLLGGDALNEIDKWIEGTSFLTLGKEIAYHHHEKWDGTGYPKGLKGTAIPLSARIVALADVYDALTSRRCYKEAFNHEKSRDIIIGLKGSHFDPVVVDAFLTLEDDFRRIRKEMNELTEQKTIPVNAVSI